jgi:hypothetical protein
VDGTANVLLYNFPESAKSIRIFTYSATGMSLLCAGSVSIQIFGAYMYDSMPSQSMSDGLLFWNAASPLWSFALVGLSSVFIGLAKVLSSATVSRVELLPKTTRGPNRPHLLVYTHRFWGGLKLPGTVYTEWSGVVDGSGFKSFVIQDEMITFLPNGPKFGTFHNFLEIKKNSFSDRTALVEALALCVPPEGRSAVSAVAPGGAVAVKLKDDLRLEWKASMKKNKSGRK